MDKRCVECGVSRPRWHGGPHKCKRVGQLVEFGTIGPFFIKDDDVLTWLNAP